MQKQGNMDRAVPYSRKGSTGVVIVAVIATLVVCALIGVIVFLLLRNKEPEPENNTSFAVQSETPTPTQNPEPKREDVPPDRTRGEGTLVTPQNAPQVFSEMAAEEPTPVGSYEVTMNVRWSFPEDGGASTDAYVENSTSNQNTVYFTIAEESTPNEVIYASPNIPVGSHLEGIKLDEPLSKGEHSCVLTYHLLDEDDETELSSVSVALTIVVGE